MLGNAGRDVKTDLVLLARGLKIFGIVVIFRFLWKEQFWERAFLWYEEAFCKQDCGDGVEELAKNRLTNLLW